ncbi:DUF6493 family protein [Flavobacterium branchiophilum]|uniref:Molybdenum metabolism regulator n=1 Tax=Flavobacterium branchiophilum TaxID=55197 RepID=A0A2H3KZ66_9FLAO|nr:DUF6493 family protein [Flavobacterium branchiophilum]PDS25127.1 molybdenum metabolism regulator [Flavobacterium branchiophilum]
MKKHLKYIDGTSDKFWQIEAQGIQFTVTYGKNGTSGTSQTKTFSTEAECLKMAEKLVAEKIKKGYSESGEVVVDSTSKAGKAKTAIQEITAEYDQLIKEKRMEALLPFLQEKVKGNVTEFKKHLKKCKKYWCDYADLTNEPQFRKGKQYNWGRRGDEIQSKIINLTAMAVVDKTEINAFDGIASYLEAMTTDAIIKELIFWAKPNWIAEYLLNLVKRNEWASISYYTLRYLEQEKLIAFHAELYAISLAQYNEYQVKDSAQNFIKKLAQDALALQRDVPLLFEYETAINNVYFRTNNDQPYNQFKLWHVALLQFVNDGNLKRATVIENGLLIQTKEWNNGIKTFFKKVVEEMKPTTEELIANQNVIFTFLQNAYAPIITFGVDLCKTIFEDKKFKTNDFLEWLEPLFYREDAKGSIKKLLPMLEKISKTNSKTSTKIAHLVCHVFVIPDLTLQERTVKTLLKTANKKDKTIKEKLSEYVGQMQGSVKMQLADFLGNEADENAVFEVEKYHYQPEKVNKLVSEVHLPTDWNEILFQFGKFINNEGILDAEILMHSLVLQQHLFPADYQKQLEPYDKQLKKTYFSCAAKEFVKGYLIEKIMKLNQKANMNFSSHNHVKTMHFYKSILACIEEKILMKSTLPLLSFPTHEPHWVAPKTLLERLIAYQNTNESMDYNDLSLAISRMPLEQVEAATPLLSQLEPELKNLFEFCFGLHKEIKIPKEGLLNKLFQKAGGETMQSKNTALWAVAAQTFYPNDYFEAFDKTTLAGIPFAGNPFHSPINFVEKANEWVDYQTKEKMRHTWMELAVELPGFKKLPNHLLYSLDCYFVGENSWYHFLYGEDSVYYWNDLMPQNKEPLAVKLLLSACVNTSSGSDILTAFLHLANRSDFEFSHYCSAVFACCFFMDKKNVRLLASEVMYQKIESQTFPIEQMSGVFAYLISNNYGVFGRFSDAVLSIKDSSPLHNQALFLLLDGVLSNWILGEKLPTNFKKFIENYYDLSTKLNQKPSEKAKQFLVPFQENTSLKKLVGLLIK